MFLVHPAGIRQNTGRDQNRGGVLRRHRTESHLQARDVGKNKLSRINRNHLRPREDFLRAASRHLLARNRSHPIRRPVHRYRTELSRRNFYGNAEEKKIAEASKEKLTRSGKFKKPIVTEILPAIKFWAAEDYHQKYYRQNPEHFEAFEEGSGRVSFKKDKWGGKQ